MTLHAFTYANLQEEGDEMAAMRNSDVLTDLVDAAIERGACIKLSHGPIGPAEAHTNLTNDIRICDLKLISRLIKALSPPLATLNLRPADFIRPIKGGLVLPILQSRWTARKAPRVADVQETEWMCINTELNRCRDLLKARVRMLSRGDGSIGDLPTGQGFDPESADVLLDALITLLEHEIYFELPDPQGAGGCSPIDLPSRSSLRIAKTTNVMVTERTGMVTGFDLARNCLFIEGSTAVDLGSAEKMSVERLFGLIDKKYKQNCAYSYRSVSYKLVVQQPDKLR